MNKPQSKFIYLFIVIIIILGIVSFVFKQNLTDTFLTYNFDNKTVKSNDVVSAINLDLLREEKVKSLKDNVYVFDYDDLNKTQDQLAKDFKPVIIVSDSAASSTEELPVVKTVFFRVNVGNSNPFVVEKKPK